MEHFEVEIYSFSSATKLHQKLSLPTVMKERFDSKHQPLALKVGDLAYIRLHRGYKVASKVHRKFGPQRTGPSKVTSVLPTHAGPGVVLTNDEQMLNSIGVAGSHVGSDFEPRYDPQCFDLDE